MIWSIKRKIKRVLWLYFRKFYPLNKRGASICVTSFDGDYDLVKKILKADAKKYVPEEKMKNVWLMKHSYDFGRMKKIGWARVSEIEKVPKENVLGRLF